MTYYTVTGNPPTQTRGTSATIRAEFALIAAGFTSAAGDINARGLITGQTWTGTHTFPATTYGVTAAFGSGGTAYATLDFVNSVATNAALPGQAANAGKFMRTNGTSAAWSELGIKGADVPSSATIDLSSADGDLRHVTGTTTITAITIPVGAERTVIFDGVLTLTNGAALLLPGAANITTAAGDRMVVRGDTAGANVVTYTRANGQAVYASKQFRAITYLSASGTYVAPANGLLRITLAGAMGSGAVANSLNDTASSAVASGGAAGGLSIKTLQVLAGDTFTVTLGAGGAQVTTSSAGAHVNGNAGGSSTITGPGTSMTANGGNGGIGANAATGAVSVAGATGGTATGGDANYTGGGSGSAAVTGASGIVATGGGATAWSGLAYSSGNATYPGSAGISGGAASGGAGIGGASGVATENAVSSATTTGGGGAQGPSPAATHANGANGVGAPSVVTSTPLSLNGAGNSIGGGAGGGANAGSTTATGTAGGLLAGGGAVVIYSINTTSTATANGGSGGSTGGAACRMGSVSSTSTSQAGADAFAIFEWTEA